MGSQERDCYEGNIFLNHRSSEELGQKVACRTIDHWHAPMRRPRQMEKDLVSCHAGKLMTTNQWQINHSHGVHTLKRGPNEALRLSAVISWAHSLEC